MSYVGIVRQHKHSSISNSEKYDMKRFILALSAFTTSMLCLLTLLSTARYASLESKCSKLFNVKSNQKILILGDSHAQCAFVEKPEFGIKMLVYHSTPMNVSLMRLKELEQRNGLEKVKLCVLNFCYTTIGEWSEKGQLESSWRMMPYALKYCELIPVDSIWVYLYLMKQMIVHPRVLPPLAVNPSARRDEIAFVDRPADWQKENIDRAIGRHFGGRKGVKDSKWHQLQTLREINEVCKKNGINLVLLSTPLTKGYYERIPDWARRNMEWWKKRVEEVGIPYYDYMQRGEPDMFADADHLSKAGAEKFTNQFYCEVLQPLLDVQ